eukprot:g43570.t1
MVHEVPGVGCIRFLGRFSAIGFQHPLAAQIRRSSCKHAGPFFAKKAVNPGVCRTCEHRNNRDDTSLSPDGCMLSSDVMCDANTSFSQALNSSSSVLGSFMDSCSSRPCNQAGRYYTSPYTGLNLMDGPNR